MTLAFSKMNGAGNDFVLIDNREGSLALAPGGIALLCDRHRGVGADGVLMVEAPRGGADFRMRYFNADGGEAEMCGNGARCFARFCGRLDGERETVAFETPAGVIHATLLPNAVRLVMSDPVDHRAPVSLEVQGGFVETHFINTGVPHAVVFVEDLERTDVHGLGRALREHDHFAPRGTNANFVEVLAPRTLALRTYERGVEAETLACGTGVCAAALIHHALTGAPSPIRVGVRGGDQLTVGFDTELRNVTLTGPADFVFEGTITLP